MTSDAVIVTIEPRPNGNAFLVASCPVKGHCRFPVWTCPAEGTMWQWDGNIDRPTVSPSIDCRGGCGQHFTVVEGTAQ